MPFASSKKQNSEDKKLHVTKLVDDTRFKGMTTMEAAKFLMGEKSVTTRASEQSINFPLLVQSAFLILVVPVGYFMLLSKSLNSQNMAQAIRQTEIAQNGYSFPSMQTQTPQAPDITTYLTPQVVIVATQPATITPPPSPTPTATLYSSVVVFRYSYYNPALGGVNCLTWDDTTKDCTSTLATGEDWRGGYGSVIACPPEYALGTKFEIISPAQLAGVWTCKDRGGAILGDIIDFLDVNQKADWLSPVIVNVYPPHVSVEQISPGTH